MMNRFLNLLKLPFLKCFQALSIALLLLFSGVSSAEAYSESSEARFLNQSDALIYVPSGLSPNRRYPILFTFSPGADAAFMTQFWRGFAEEHKWIIYASKEYRNNLNMNQLYPVMKGRMEHAMAQLPADTSRVVLTGMSGGGSFSHAMNLTYPGTVSAVIVNTGRIWDDVYARAEKNLEPYPERFGNSRRLAVFLASPGDFRYREMQRDEALLRRMGWRTHWIEFEGGHTYAPAQAYAQAIQWIESQNSWH